MKETKSRSLCAGTALLAAFACWTVLIRCADVRPAGPNGSTVGLAAFNVWFHHTAGVHMPLYTVTDWLGLVPIAVCLGFAVLGFRQMTGRRSLPKVDRDLLLLGGYYILVIFAYLFFEMVPINYRPVLIGGSLEASYPSSTTLLVLSVMPTLKYQIDRRCGAPVIRRIVTVSAVLFSSFMVVGRLLSGVHWATDIIGSVFLSQGLFMIYRHAVEWTDRAGKTPAERS
ncbi:MAG: phosphatase PAP2 family protein [Lachnospiraceae bacterium]|nr:phosphatase PAP2 family protein [Lachnospiraceae bacterium]